MRPIIRKNKTSRKPFIPEGVRIKLPKPRIPLCVFWKVHENKNLQMVSPFYLDR